MRAGMALVGTLRTKQYMPHQEQRVVNDPEAPKWPLVHVPAAQLVPNML